MLLSKAIDALVVATRADGRSPRTATSYREKLRPLRAALGDVPVGSITTSDLRAFVITLMDQDTTYRHHPTRPERQRPLSGFTVASHVRAFKRLFKFLEEEGVITENPARRIRTPRPKREQPKGITRADLLALLATANTGSALDRRDRAIILTLADTGCRVGGLCGLRLGDVDLQAHRAILAEKGGKVRTAFFTETTAGALRSWLDVRPAGAGDTLFLWLRGEQAGSLATTSINKMLAARGKRAGVTGPVNPHSFRHAFARDYLLDGGDLGTLADILGHSDVGVTKAYYAIFTARELQAQHAAHSPIARLMAEGGTDGKAL